MQPAAPGHDKTDRVALRKGVGVEQSEAVNNEKFWNLAESQVPPEQVCGACLAFWMTRSTETRSVLTALFPSLFQLQERRRCQTEPSRIPEEKTRLRQRERCGHCRCGGGCGSRLRFRLRL